MTPIPPIAPKTLPYWAQLMSFVLAGVGFFGTAYVGLAEFFKSAEVETKLTKDCFYRLVEQGEAVFCRATVLARRGPVLIRGVRVTLAKQDGAKKAFPLEVNQFGTLVTKADKLVQEHNYYGRSTLHYLPEDKPERLVYFCLHREEYRTPQSTVVENFKVAMKQAKEGLIPEAPVEGPLSETQNQIVRALVQSHIAAVMGSLQLEQGQYELSIALDYESTNARFRRFRKLKTSKASLTFTIPQDFTRNMRSSVEKTLGAIARNELYGKKEAIAWPEFTPKNFVEN